MEYYGGRWVSAERKFGNFKRPRVFGELTLHRYIGTVDWRLGTTPVGIPLLVFYEGSECSECEVLYDLLLLTPHARARALHPSLDHRSHHT